MTDNKSSFTKLMQRIPSQDAPLVPKTSDELEPPLRPTMRWVVAKGGSLFKKFEFKDGTERNRFVAELLEYEIEAQHSAVVKIDAMTVMVAIQTKDLGALTALDKEYANTADAIYKDVIETTTVIGQVDQS